MSIVLSWSGDGLSTGPLTTSSAGTGDTAPAGLWGSGASTLTVDDSGARPPCIKVVQASGDAAAPYWDHSALTEYAGRMYFTTPSAWPSASQTIMQAAADGGGISVKLVLAGSGAPGQWRLYAGASTELGRGSTNTLSPSTRYRLEWKVTATRADAALYEGDSLTALESLGGAGTYAAASRHFFGTPQTSPTLGTFYLDDIAVADTADYIGPKVAPAADTVRVAAVIDAGSWSAFGASDIKSGLNDESDSTGAECADDTALVCRWGNLTDGDVTQTFRLSHDTAGTQAVLTALQGSATIATKTVTLTTTAADYTITAASNDITDRANLRFSVKKA